MADEYMVDEHMVGEQMMKSALIPTMLGTDDVDAEDNIVESLLAEGASRKSLKEMLVCSTGMTKDLEKIARAQFVGDILNKFQEIQTSVVGYNEDLTTYLSLIDERDPISTDDAQEFEERLFLMTSSLTSKTKKYLTTSVGKLTDLISTLAKQKKKTSTAETLMVVEELSTLASNMYGVLNAINADFLHDVVDEVSPNAFIVAYARAAHNIANAKPEKVLEKYQNAGSVQEVGNLMDEFKANGLAFILGNELPPVHLDLSNFPVKASKKQKLKFLEQALTPETNELYQEMEKVASAGSRYFNQRNKLREEISYLEDASGFLDVIMACDSIEESGVTESSFDELKSYNNYLNRRPHLKDMVFFGKEVATYHALFNLVSNKLETISQMQYGAVGVVIEEVIEDANVVDVSVDTQVIKQGVGDTVITKDIVDATMPPAVSVDYSAEHNLATDYVSLEDLSKPTTSKLRPLYNLLHGKTHEGVPFLGSGENMAEKIDAFELNGDFTHKEKGFIQSAVAYLRNNAETKFGTFTSDNPITNYVGNFLKTADSVVR